MVVSRCCAKALEIVADKIKLLLTSRGPVSRVLAQHEGTKDLDRSLEADGLICLHCDFCL